MLYPLVVELKELLCSFRLYLVVSVNMYILQISPREEHHSPRYEIKQYLSDCVFIACYMIDYIRQLIAVRTGDLKQDVILLCVLMARTLSYWG